MSVKMYELNLLPPQEPIPLPDPYPALCTPASQAGPACQDRGAQCFLDLKLSPALTLARDSSAEALPRTLYP